jgi:hypothetical protein
MPERTLTMPSTIDRASLVSALNDLDLLALTGSLRGTLHLSRFWPSGEGHGR